MSTTSDTEAPNNAGPCCAICAEPKALYSICTTCVGSDKLCCLKCHSRLLKMCDPTSSCVAIHYTCAFCRTEVLRDVLRSSPLFNSDEWCRSACALWKQHCIDVMKDRLILENMLSDAVAALAHIPLRNISQSQRHRILMGTRASLLRAADFIQTYDGFMRHRARQPSYQDEQAAMASVRHRENQEHVNH